MVYYSGIGGETTATPTNLAPVDAVVAFLKAHSLNTWRVVFLPAFKADASSPYNKAIIQRYLDTFTDGIVIVDPYCVTGGDTVALHPTLWADLNTAALQVCRDFPNNPRVFVEIINEYYAADLYTQSQKILNNIRAAGYTNRVGINSISQMPQNLNDPLNKVSYSYHFYMNLFTPSGVMTKIAQMQALGQSIIATEVGADTREISYFTATEIAALENTVSQMQAKGAGFCLWLMRDLINWTGIAPTWKNTARSYSGLGFVFPPTSPPPPPPPISYVLDVSAVTGGTTSPTGSISYPSGTTVKVSATPAQGYRFGGWLVNGVSHPATENPLTLTMTAAETVIPIFNAIPPQQTGTLDIHAYDNGVEVAASVTVGTQTGRNTPFTVVVNVGGYVLTCLYEGNTVTQTVTVTAGQTLPVSFQFFRVPPTQTSQNQNVAVAVLIVLGIGAVGAAIV